jgi:hypothetical protein
MYRGGAVVAGVIVDFAGIRIVSVAVVADIVRVVCSGA